MLSACSPPSPLVRMVVYDPSLQMQSIINTAQELAKFLEVINNQVNQIKTMTDQLNEFKHYKELFGDPRAVLVPTMKALTDDLRRTELGVNLETLRETADGLYALTYNASGIYHTVGETFTTPGGTSISRSADEYRPFAAAHRTAENYLAVAKDAASRRANIKEQIALATEQLKSARTDAEVQKLNGVLVALSADLASADHEVNQALASVLVQDMENRNDEKKQIEARKEEQHAEFTEAMGKYGKKFQLLTVPTKFPVK